MTADAGIGRSGGRRKVGARHAKAVIAARIDHHVGGGRHVAADAARGLAGGVVEVMSRRGVLRRLMTLRADRIALGAQFLRVRVVAVGTGHAGAMHPALQERAPGEHLIALLTIGVIQTGRQQRRKIVVEERFTRSIVFRKLRATRMALRAGVDLVCGIARTAPAGVSGGRIDRPADPVALAQRHGQSLAVVVLARRACPGQVRGSGSMATLAADADLGPGGLKRSRCGVIALADPRRVAVGAHEVPVLRSPGPVQLIAMIEPLVGVLPEPALPALRLRPRVPRHRKRLQPAAGQFDQVLLERLEAEGVADLEVGKRAVWAIRSGDEPAVASEEGRGHAVAHMTGHVEVAQHVFRGGLLHGARMLRLLPTGRLLLMAGGAGCAADVVGRLRRGSSRGMRGRRWFGRHRQPPCRQRRREHGHRQCSPQHAAQRVTTWLRRRRRVGGPLRRSPRHDRIARPRAPTPPLEPVTALRARNGLNVAPGRSCSIPSSCS